MSALHKIALTFLKSVGPVTARNLLEHFGSAEAVFAAGNEALKEIPGIRQNAIHSILSKEALKRAEEELVFIARYGIEILFYTDSNYPQRLKECVDAPILLYFKGRADLNQLRILSIVGTRNATLYGKNICKELIEALVPYNVMVVSGLAYGIDIAVHQACVEHQVSTVGILGHGLDRLYPSAHKPVAQQMLLNGGLLTEFPILTNPDRQNFPQRNRIIAGLSDATIVVEASEKGGALITAEIANSYHKDVYAFPGRVNDPFSAGCNFLIKTNRAGLINHAQDLIYYLGWDRPVSGKNTAVQSALPLGLNPQEQKVFSMLAQNPCSIDQLSVALGMQQSNLAMVLLTLEMKGVMVSLPGKVYKLV